MKTRFTLHFIAVSNQNSEFTLGPLKKNRGNSKRVARILNLGLGLDLGLNLGLVLIRGLFVRHGCGRADHPGERGHCRGAARRCTLMGQELLFWREIFFEGRTNQ